MPLFQEGQRKDHRPENWLGPQHAAAAPTRQPFAVCQPHDARVASAPPHHDLDGGLATRRHCSEQSRLCDVVCDDGTRYRIRACMKGYLLELNQRIKEDPELLHTRTMTEGYVAVLQPKREDEDKVSVGLLSEAMYSARQAKRAKAGGGAGGRGAGGAQGCSATSALQDGDKGQANG